MANRGYDEWQAPAQVYAPNQVESVLRALGIEVVEDTVGFFMSMCPYHGNTDTPAFSTNQTSGRSMCFNPACAVGTEEPLSMEQMVKDLKGYNPFEAKRFIIKNRGNATFQETFDSIRIEPEELVAFPQVHIDKMESRFWETTAAVEYMHGRGFNDETLRHFHVGFTPAAQRPIYRAHDMIVVPAYDHTAKPVGLVGRSIIGKQFKNYGPDNGRGFHKSKMVWNLNNARRYETIILNEATFDGMAVHQAGYPNVGALLGGTLSKVQAELLRRHFSTVIIMTDNENVENDEMTYHQRCTKCLRLGFDMCQGHAAGRDLGMKIAEELGSSMRIKWAVYDDKHVYANNVKDARAMTDDEIRQTLRNSISHYDYLELVA